ncbi:hypothetical protein FA95DRAFT_1496723 [Auriscalpium vulgare]|uniref:Uncharacterized protein n=1 Tax=Auriscalpium vulgare TaxID=40419 RepID=A0ACB8RLV8_9AGAM|nr:hypothetical protein FA95DRAFT_1496723 [Auriscalpium vulgare]
MPSPNPVNGSSQRNLAPPAADVLTATLSSTWDQVKDGSKYAPSAVRVLDTVEGAAGTVLAAKSAMSTVMPVVSAAMTAIEETHIAEVVQDGINKFFDGMPVLMNALDAVADLHPFIGVVVMAFKTVYTLELKRRENEKKIIALYVEMKDMMTVLLQCDVRDDQMIAPDQRSVQDRLEALTQKTADDIKACSNICDTYSKKKLLAKVFQGPMWDAKLLTFVSLFTKRRTEFEFALSIHTSKGVDKANVKLDVVDDTTKKINEKMEAMMAMFQQLVSKEQRELSALVDAQGGIKAVRSNDKALRELHTRVKSGTDSDGHRLGAEMPAFEELKEDLAVTPDVAIENNMIVFSRKFEVQKRQIVDEMTLVVKRESDRIIKEVKAGAHERILDKSIHDIWKDMGWRGNVKARHFVLALRDYYVESQTSSTQAVRGINTLVSNNDPDAWAIKFIDVSRVQPILEAFDDDASGFITVAEMNRFTSGRPLDWSLAHWIAFWAAGWKASIIEYASKIEAIFAKMEGIHAKLHPANRQHADDYFRFAWKAVHTLTATMIKEVPESLPEDKFGKYIQTEEARLTENLKAVEYNIDGLDTLALVTGVGRIEKASIRTYESDLAGLTYLQFAFPVLYLLVKRHYEVMRIARTKVISPRELFDGVESILYVADALRFRMRELQNIFNQQKLDLDKQFKSFAYGVFKYIYKETDLWNPKYVKDLDPDVTQYNDATEDQTIKPEDILKHDYSDKLSYDDWVYDGETIERKPDDTNVSSPIKDVLGHWNGYFYDDGAREVDGGDSMMTLAIEVADGENNVKAIGWSNRGRFLVEGTCQDDEHGVPQLALKWTFTGSSWKKIYFYGHHDVDSGTLSGSYGYFADPESTVGEFVFKRIAPQHMVFYPDNTALAANKARSLWTFAIEAVRQEVRRERWSWSYFKQRRDDRKVFIESYVRWQYFGTPLTDEESERFTKVSQRILPADVCFYSSRILEIKATTAIHENAFCDGCGGRIGGPRVVCLDCVIKSDQDFNTLDLCDKDACVTARVTVDARADLSAPHEPTHHLMKVRTTVPTRQYGRVDRKARAVLKKIEGTCKTLAAKRVAELENLTVEVAAAATTLAAGDASQLSKRLSTISKKPEVEPTAPKCGACKEPVTLPCWYCCKCTDDLYICNACDAKGVPKIEGAPGHSEEHFLVRAQAPEALKASDESKENSTEQRLMSLEKRMENIEVLLQRLAEASTVTPSTDPVHLKDSERLNSVVIRPDKVK